MKTPAVVVCQCGMEANPIIELQPHVGGTDSVEARLVVRFSREWYVTHKDRHLAFYPDSDDRTRAAFDLLIERVPA